MESLKEFFPLIISTFSIVISYFVKTQVEIRVLKLDKELTEKNSILERELNEKINSILIQSAELETEVREVKTFVTKIYELVSKGKKNGSTIISKK